MIFASALRVYKLRDFDRKAAACFGEHIVSVKQVWATGHSSTAEGVFGQVKGPWQPVGLGMAGAKDLVARRRCSSS